MIVKNKYEIWITAIPYAIIAVIIFIFNIISIWGFDGLLFDDQDYYFRLFNKNIDDLKFSRNIIHAIYILEIIKISIITSIYTARLLIIALLIIPCAFFIYYFARYHYNLIPSISVTIAVIPFILSNEVLLPAYVVGSYMILAILFAFITIFFILKLSKNSDFSNTDFFLASTFYVLAFESSELIAFMLPVFLFLILTLNKLTLKRVLLVATFSLLAFGKSILVIIRPYGQVNSVQNSIPISTIHKRVLHFMDIINPLHGLTNVSVLNIILLSIIIIGAIIIIAKRSQIERIHQFDSSVVKPDNKYFYIVYYFMFPLIWLIFSILPFLLFSQYFSSRYFTIAAIALSFMFIVSISLIYSLFSNRKLPLVIILFILIMISGFNRQQTIRKYYKPKQSQYSELKQALNNYDLPGNSQIVITSSKQNLSIGNGITNKANGVLQYILKRRDITGQIMNEKSFYDPFKIYNLPWIYPNMDIDTTKNTWLLRCFNKDSSQNRRLHYALRWVDEKRKDSPWSIFYFDEQGIKTNLISGIGYNSYELTVDSLSVMAIKRDDILFGGIPTSNDSLRLGL